MSKEIQAGVLVRVVNNELESYGLVGIVIGYHSNCTTSVDVYFENWNGQGEKTLYIKVENLEVEGENYMVLTGDFKVAVVNLVYGCSLSKRYGFALYDDIGEVNAGDMVLVDANNQIQLAKVCMVMSQEEYAEYSGMKNGIAKEVVCRVDLSIYDKRKAVRNRISELKVQMNNLAQKNQQLTMYKMMAEHDPAMKVLYDEFVQLSTVNV